jgi:general secretion pathway protein G
MERITPTENHRGAESRGRGLLKGGGAFTIVEVLVVIMLIGLLAVFVVPRYLERAQSAKRNVAKAQLADLEKAISMFYMDCGRYPDTSDGGLQSLLKAPSSLTEKWHGPYTKESQLVDPWGRPIVYAKPGVKNPDSYDILSYGKDGQPGGEGDNADIYNN